MSTSTIRSMTGFGAANAEVEGSKYAVEVRSVNNKFLKTIVRLPDELIPLETDLETAVARRLRRGSVMVTIRCVASGSAIASRIDAPAARAVVEQLLDAMPPEIRERCTIDVAGLLSVPGVAGGEDSAELQKIARPILFRLLDEACDALVEMREREGDALLDGPRPT